MDTTELQSYLRDEFSRSTKFAVNRVANITPVKKFEGTYGYFNPSNLVKLPGTSLRGFECKRFQCDRYEFPFRLVPECSNPQVAKAHAGMLAQLAMASRSLLVYDLLTNPVNHVSSHVNTAAYWGGDLKVVLENTAKLIGASTFDKVDPKNLTLVINPNSARRIAKSGEFVAEGVNAVYGLSDYLHGVRLVVADTVVSRSYPASDTIDYVFPDNTAVLLGREADLETAEGMSSFSAVHIFVFEDMVIEVDDATGAITLTDSVVPQMVAPVSAVLITSLFDPVTESPSEQPTK